MEEGKGQRGDGRRELPAKDAKEAAARMQLQCLQRASSEKCAEPTHALEAACLKLLLPSLPSSSWLSLSACVRDNVKQCLRCVVAGV